MITIKRKHHCCTGHRVVGQGGHCENLHGHDYYFEFVCTAPNLDSIGRIIDFSVMKEKLCSFIDDNWDHATLIWDQDPWLSPLTAINPSGVVAVPFNPTAENMAKFLVEVVGPDQLKSTGVELIEVTIHETSKCSATYRKPE